MQPFEYIEPRSSDEAVAFDEAVALLGERLHDSQLIAGGCDLLCEMKDGLATS